MVDRSKPSVLILAGGKSERMKYPKPWLSFNNEETFLEKIVREYYEFGSRQLLIVINEKYCNSPWDEKLSELNSYATIIKNDRPEKGKSHSILLGLEHISNDEYLFVQNIDNPFVDMELLTKLNRSRTEMTYSVPIYKNKSGHPILISKSIINELKCSDPESLHFRNILRKFKRSEVVFSKKEILANINVQEDYRNFFNKEMSLIKE